MTSQYHDAIIIGAGAAGLLCAIEAGKRGRRVLLLDKAEKAGKKILISGGGRCNFTNLNTAPEHYLSANPHFCKSALARYTQWDFMNLMAENGLTWHEKTLGQLFCDQRAGAVVNMLLRLCDEAGVTLCLNTTIQSIKKTNTFEITADDKIFSSESLVIATGGPSIPRMGATDFGIQVAQQFGLATQPFRAALVPLRLKNSDMSRTFHGLAGIATEVVVSCNSRAFRENLLITHKGLSGPAILQISSYWQPGDAIEINFLPNLDAQSWPGEIKLSSPDTHLKTVLGRLLPRKLGQRLAELIASDRPLRQFSEHELRQIIDRLQHWHLTPEATEGMRTAEVSTGGVDTSELSSKTFAAKKQPGLYFIGETIDVTGQLGGYNFQWAWSSGWCAGQEI